MVSLPAYVLEHAAELGDEPALIDGPTGRVLTYAQLADQVARLAGGLRARGFGPGDVLGVMAPNLPEYAVLFHGVAMAGGTITTINPTYTAPEVHHQLTDAGAALSGDDPDVPGGGDRAAPGAPASMPSSCSARPRAAPPRCWT